MNGLGITGSSRQTSKAFVYSDEKIKEFESNWGVAQKGVMITRASDDSLLKWNGSSFDDEGNSGPGPAGSGGLFKTPFLIGDSDQSIYADGQKGLQDPEGVEGWYFKNSASLTNKINWYYINNFNITSSMTISSLQGGYAVIFVRSETVAPFLNFYTKRKNDGNDFSWYRSRVSYNDPNILTGYLGQSVVLYWGTEPNVYPDYPRIQLPLDQFTTDGPQESDEEIFLASLSTSTNYTEGSFEFTAKAMGYFNDSEHINLPCISHNDISELSSNVSDLQIYLEAVRQGKFFRGYVMNETEMLSLSSPYRYEYVARVDNGTLWEYDGTVWYDTLIEASLSGIVQEQQLVLPYSDTHYITLDGNDNALHFTNVDSDFMDLTAKWNISIEVETVSTINDGTYTTLLKRGNNEICLLKGGSNWGFYVFCDGVSVGQANTWYDPEPGTKIQIMCYGNRMEYWSKNQRRANVTWNSNINLNDASGDLYFGQGGKRGGNWYGGVNNMMFILGTSGLFGSDQRTEYFSGKDVTVMSFFPSVYDFVLLGERPYPNLLGLKRVVEGELIFGTETDFYQRPTPGAIGVPFTNLPGKYIKLDGTDNHIELTGVNTDILDFTKQWAISLKLKNVSGVNDSSYTVTFRRGDNEITLRKGGSNWGIYVYANGLAVCQANTWYAPTFDSTIMFIGKGSKFEYYLNGARRANMSYNGNISNNNPSGNLLIGESGNIGSHWYGGVKDSIFMSGPNSQLNSSQVNEYVNTEDLTQLSYYSNVDDAIDFGADVYPNVNGLKGQVSGTLLNGTIEDFVDIEN